MRFPRSRRTRALAAALTAGLIGILTLSGTALTTSASPNTGQQAASGQPAVATKPTIVLVHGAFADSSGWDAVAGRLLDAGYRVLAFSNPLRGPLADGAYLCDFLTTIEGPVVLVGHSYGGAVITNAATSNPNVKALVYVAAYAPAEGESAHPPIPSVAATPRSPIISSSDPSQARPKATPTPTSTRPTTTASSPRICPATPPASWQPRNVPEPWPHS
ncbi:MAG: alpha/beta fold hydrolase [Kribbellaceae bacterium]